MNQVEVNSLQPIIDKYTPLEWYINRVGAGPDGYTMRIKSPRMQYPLTLDGVFSEDEMLIAESQFVSAQNHLPFISATLEKVLDKVIKDVAALYLLQARGKEGVVIPDEIIINDLKIPLK